MSKYVLIWLRLEVKVSQNQSTSNYSKKFIEKCNTKTNQECQKQVATVLTSKFFLNDH